MPHFCPPINIQCPGLLGAADQQIKLIDGGDMSTERGDLEWLKDMAKNGARPWGDYSGNRRCPSGGSPRWGAPPRRTRGSPCDPELCARTTTEEQLARGTVNIGLRFPVGRPAPVAPPGSPRERHNNNPSKMQHSHLQNIAECLK